MRRASIGFVVAIAICASSSTPPARARTDQRTASAQSPPKQSPKASNKQSEPRLEFPSGAKTAPSWVYEKPARWTQTQKSPRERGVNPCLTRDPGFASYESWERTPMFGQWILPKQRDFAKDGSFDVMFHFHGHEAARKEWVHVMHDTVLVGIDLGLGSGPYLRKFASPEVFRALLDNLERAVERHAGVARARARRIGLSAWSAGYGAVEQILRSEYGRRTIDTVVLLDGLHSGYLEGKLNEPKLSPFVDFARDAVRSRKFMFVSHSSIIPPNYASTTETSNFLIWQVGGKPQPASPRPSDPMGLELISRFTAGSFHVRGFAGNDTGDHCAHLGLYRDVLKAHVAPRWEPRSTG